MARQSGLPTPANVVSHHGRRISIEAKNNIEAFLTEEYKSNNSCKSFPFLMLFWIIFIATQWGHREIDIAFQLQSVMLEAFGGARIPHHMNSSYIMPTNLSNVGPRVKEINTWGDVMSWMELSLVPLVWGKDESVAGRIFDANKVLGGIRMKQDRLAPGPCPGPDALINWYSGGCFSQGGDLDLREPEPEVRHLQGERPDDDGARMYWLDISQSKANVELHLQELRSRRWLSEATSHAAVQVVLYNGREAVFVLIQATFDMSNGGAMVPKVTLKTLPSVIYRSWVLAIGDTVLMLLLMWFLLGEITVCYRAWKTQHFKELLKPITVANWSLVMGGIAFTAFFSHLSIRLGGISDRIPELIDTTPPTVLDPTQAYVGTEWEARHNLMNESFDEMSHLAGLLRYAELSTFWYCMLMLVKFLQAFEASPRLAVITETLREAMSDIVHFGIILAFVFVNFSVGACFLFGHQLKEWSSMQYATNSSFRAVMGDYDFMAMSAIAPVSATVWFWLFMVLIYLIMINMFLAIVMDAYIKVKERTQNRPALWNEFFMSFSKKVSKKQLNRVLPRSVTSNLEAKLAWTNQQNTTKDDESDDLSLTDLNDPELDGKGTQKSLGNSKELRIVLAELKALREEVGALRQQGQRDSTVAPLKPARGDASPDRKQVWESLHSNGQFNGNGRGDGSQTAQTSQSWHGPASTRAWDSPRVVCTGGIHTAGEPPAVPPRPMRHAPGGALQAQNWSNEPPSLRPPRSKR